MTTLPDLSQLSHAQKDALILMLWQQVQQLTLGHQQLQAQLQLLQSRLGQTSKNSSRPPSSDGLAKPAPQSLRVAGQRTSGGQTGHSGTTLRQSSQVDQTIQHPPLGPCSACQLPLPLSAMQIAQSRQIFELPPLRLRVIAHQQMRATCACGAVHLGAWPPGVNAPAQYGASIQAMAVHLNQYHLLPLARTAALLRDLVGVSLSQASIQAFAQQAAAVLSPTVAAIGQAVQASAVAHADESGIRITGKLHWLHCLVTHSLTWLAPHARRGSAAVDALGLLGGFKGTLVHDGLASYKELACTHSLCNAHHLRELVYVHENEAEKVWDNWAQEMMALLRQALGEVDQARGPLDGSRQAYFEARWSALLERGEALNEPVLRTDTSADASLGIGKRGRPKQSKAHNLLKRLRTYRADVWRFMTDKDVPFTNNLAEQALRMCKVKQKISGCFRTAHGADTFFTIRSYLATMGKQKANLHDCLVSVFQGQPVQPSFVG